MVGALEWEDSDSCASPAPPTQKVYCCNEELWVKAGLKGSAWRPLRSLPNCEAMVALMEYLVAHEAQGREGFGWPSPQLLVLRGGKWGLLHTNSMPSTDSRVLHRRAGHTIEALLRSIKQTICLKFGQMLPSSNIFRVINAISGVILASVTTRALS